MSLHPPHHLTCKVMADRAGQKIAASFDGTYRYMDIGGKGWTLLDGGPLTSYYSGTGSESEYSTSVINCIFQFCKFESTETYVSYFTAYKDLPVLLLGLDPFIPDIVGSDRARAIVNASLLVWPGTHNVLCWPHVYLYIKGSKFAKYMSSACTAELRESIEGDIISLHEARNQVEFDYVFETMRVVWTKAGEAGFAAYFKRHYATGVWARWWYGASITPGVKANQNSVESEHSAQKKLLGAALMKAPPLGDDEHLRSCHVGGCREVQRRVAQVAFDARGQAASQCHGGCQGTEPPQLQEHQGNIVCPLHLPPHNSNRFTTLHPGPCHRCKHLQARTIVACTSHPQLPHNTSIVTGDCASRYRLANEGRRAGHSGGLR